MTRRTETVIFQGGVTLAFTGYETEQLRKRLHPQVLEALVYGACRELFE